YDFANPEAQVWKDLIRLNQVYGRAYYTQDNHLSLLTDGKEMMDSLLDDIAHAKDTINVMYFIIKNDRVGRAFIDALTARAAAGVKVRLLVDALGSRKITESVLSEFLEAGGEVAYFFPPKFKLFTLLNLKFNYRNHRKLVAIDDSIGYIGGFNIAKEYLGESRKFGYWRDTHVRVKGGSVQDINARFLLDWRFAAKEQVNVSEVFFSPPVVRGETGIQIVSSGPDTEHEKIKRGFMKMITSAQKRIYIQTPYFVPDAPILESIKMAAQSGVEVKIMIPCKPDHIFVYWATYSYVGEIIRSGGKVYIYDDGFLHAKTMMVDGEVATVGSTNFDRRSFKLNFECNAFIYSAEQTIKMEETFRKDMEKCHELTRELYNSRSIWIRIK
ncbi:MAG: cardiolipin synthase, partial [Anaerovoracaceae bacterium]